MWVFFFLSPGTLAQVILCHTHVIPEAVSSNPTDVYRYTLNFSISRFYYLLDNAILIAFTCGLLTKSVNVFAVLYFVFVQLIIMLMFGKGVFHMINMFSCMILKLYAALIFEYLDTRLSLIFFVLWFAAHSISMRNDNILFIVRSATVLLFWNSVVA